MFKGREKTDSLIRKLRKTLSSLFCLHFPTCHYYPLVCMFQQSGHVLCSFMITNAWFSPICAILAVLVMSTAWTLLFHFSSKTYLYNSVIKQWHSDILFPSLTNTELKCSLEFWKFWVFLSSITHFFIPLFPTDSSLIKFQVSPTYVAYSVWKVHDMKVYSSGLTEAKTKVVCHKITFLEITYSGQQNMKETYVF